MTKRLEEIINQPTLLIENTCGEPPMATCSSAAGPTGSVDYRNVESGTNCVDNLDGDRYWAWL